MKNIIFKFFRHLSSIDFVLISIGIVYLWFGVLKFFPTLSPAEELAKSTIDQITLGIIPTNISYSILAIWETLIGVLLLFGMYKRFAIIIALIHMTFTFTPLILFPDISFQGSPFSFTIIGQYILKNIIIVSVLLMLLKKYKRGHSLSLNA